MRIALLISSLSQGGAERVITIMANYWVNSDHDVFIITLNDNADAPFFKLNPGINVLGLKVARSSGGIFSAVINNVKRILSIKKTVASHAPDVLISFMTETNILAIVSTYGLSIPVIVSERANPKVYPINRIWRLLRSVIYRGASKVVLQSKASADCFNEIVKANCVVIPNPIKIDISKDKISNRYPHGKKTIISVGRLVEEKGHDLLLEAFAKARHGHPEWSLIIYGDGPLRAELEDQRDRLGLAGTTHFHGVTKDPTGVMSKADLFILSSRSEGFPNALCEAMACGLPVISFDCPYGPSDIIRDNANGLLVSTGDVDKLAESMGKLMGDEDCRKRLGEEAQKISERLGIEKIMGAWDRALNALV